MFTVRRVRPSLIGLAGAAMAFAALTPGPASATTHATLPGVNPQVVTSGATCGLLFCPLVLPVLALSPESTGVSPSLDLGSVDVDLAVDPVLGSLTGVESGTALANSLGVGLDARVTGPSFEGVGLGAYAVDDFRISAGAQYNQVALLGGSGAYLADGLRLSAQAAADRVAGAEVLGSNAYVLDSLRLSGQAANDSFVGVGGEGVYAVDSLRLSDTVAAERVAGAEILGSGAYAVDSFRLSGAARNHILAGLTDSGVAYAADTLRLSGAADVDRVAGAGVLGTNAYALDAVRLSGQAANDAVAGVLDQPSIAYAADSLRLSGEIATERVAGVEPLDSGAYVLDSLRLSGQAQNDVLADIAHDNAPSVAAVDALEASTTLAAEGIAGIVEDSVRRDVVEDVKVFPQLRTIVSLVLRPFAW